MKTHEQSAQNELRQSKPLVYDKVIRFPEMMKRGEATPIVRLEYSYACNFHCSHCSISELQKITGRRSMTPADVKNIADQADAMGLAQFVISGGEPTIYPEFDAVVEAIGAERFYITTDSNGWYLDDERAEHLKSIGVDKVQISIDNLNEFDHDDFRNKRGAWDRAVKAVILSKQAGLKVLIQTVVDKQRVHSQELIDFLSHCNNVLGVPVYIGYAKPVGEWKHMSRLIDQQDIDYISELEKRYNVFTHLTPAYGYQGGCIAVKRMINITKWGDVNPCPFMQEINLGNVFDEPLGVIVKRGMEKFGAHIPTCPMATDKDYIKNYAEEVK